MPSIDEDFADSRSRSFTDLWPVAEGYQLIDGCMCGMVGGKVVEPNRLHSHTCCRSYLPMAYPEIPGALAKAATGQESDILTFVRHYGLLGYERAWRFPEELIGARTWLKGSYDATAARIGDPVAWVVAHARTVKLLLDLLGSLNDDAAIGMAIDQLTVRRSHADGSHTEGIEYQAAERGYLRPQTVQVADMPPRDAALHIISTELNTNLTGVSRTLIVEKQNDGRQGFTSLFTPCSLLDCIYWHLADAAVGGWVRGCANPRCGAFFVAKSDRVKYCPPLMGNRGVSPCMNRHKQQKHRDQTKRSLKKLSAAARTNERKGKRRKRG